MADGSIMKETPAGNSREAIERLRRDWIMAKARECAGVAG